MKERVGDTSFAHVQFVSLSRFVVVPFSLHECGLLRLTAHRQVSRCGYLVLVPKSGGEQ